MSEKMTNRKLAALETKRKLLETEKIGGAFDVTAALKEAVKTQTENSFQDYMK